MVPDSGDLKFSAERESWPLDGKDGEDVAGSRQGDHYRPRGTQECYSMGRNIIRLCGKTSVEGCKGSIDLRY